MKNIIFYLLFIFAGTAAACPDQFVCDQAGCKKVAVAACSNQATVESQLPVLGTSTTTFGPQHSALFSNQSSAVVSPPMPGGLQPGVPYVSPPPLQQPLPPAYAPGCAENGSCYGDISTVNGLPKTTHVNGYFRKDGTYVRGHYRSSGRR